MTTVTMPYRPQVDFCTTRCFSVQYGNKDKSLECWQKVLIIALGIVLVGIGGLALSYYWRDRLVQQLYDADYKIQAQPAPVPTEDTDVLSPKSFAMPTDISNVVEQIAPISNFLTPIAPQFYADAQKTRLFYFNEPKTPECFLIARFLFDAIPPGVYYVVNVSTDRVAEKVVEKNYKTLMQLIGNDDEIDLIIGHSAVQWGLISNPKTISKPWFKPARVCQILYTHNSENWKAIYFSSGSDTHHVMSDTITKFTQTWIAENAANAKRRLTVQNAISKLAAQGS